MTVKTNNEKKKEIKFRAIRKDLGITYYFYLEELVRGQVKLNSNDYYWDRSIGLEDKNGVEIYEGDIVEHVYFGAKHKRVDMLVFNEPNHRYGFIDRGSSCAFYLTPANCQKLRVLGNIYENPNLLKEQQNETK